MPTFTCPKGHSWERPDSQTAPPDSGFCPACGAAAGTLATTGPHQAGTGATQAPLPTLPASPGSPGTLPAIPGYEVLDILGRGGMGVVYKARQVKLKRLVALKMILAGAYASPQHLARFRVEAESLARLQHPNIVQVYEVGEHQGYPFFSLEFVDGGSLAKRLSGKPVPPRQAAEIVETLARAMHAAHQRGVVHRDLKPANVLMGSGKVVFKITDFGLAKKLDEESTENKTGDIFGTPSYMAPEQATGNVHEVGPATDVYALGVILYELLCGRTPFQGPLQAVLAGVLYREPPRPRSLRPQLPRDLEAICLKCLEKEPGKRYGSAQELADDLGRWQRGELVLAQPLTAGYLLRKYLHRYRLRLAVAAALLLLLVAGTAVVIWRMADLAAQRGTAQAKAEEKSLAAQTAQAKAEEKSNESLNSFLAEKKAHAQAEEARQEERVGRALAYVNQAELLVQRQDAPRALAYLMQAVVLNPYGPRAGWRLLDLLEQRNWVRAVGPVAGTAWAADGKTFFTVTRGGRLELWDRSGGVRLAAPVMLGPGVRLVAFSPDGKLLAYTRASTQRVVLREVPTGRLRASLPHTAPVNALAFSPDGKRLVSSAGDWTDELGYAQVWNVADGKEVGPRMVHWGRVAHATFSPDGKRVATASWDWTARIWDADTGQPQSDLMQHRGWVQHVCFSPDGKLLLTASWDRTLGVWDAASGKRVPGGTLIHPGPRRVCRLPAAGGSQGQDAAPGSLRRGAGRDRLPRCLAQ
jgi:tRNA A-37 threonylcarbamoyl transferase component Bud32